MRSSQPASTILAGLWRHISPRRRGQFVLLLLLMILTSFTEVLSIGAILPFLGVLTAPSQVFDHPTTQSVVVLLNITSADQLLLPITATFVVAALLAGAMRLLLLWVNTRLSFATGSDLSISMYRRTLSQPYAVHLARNSSDVINGITNKASTVTNSIFMGFNIVSSIFAIAAILLALLVIDPIIAMATFIGFGLIYGATVASTRGRLLRNSQHIARESTQVVKALQEGLGAIRDIILDGSQESFCRIYRDADLKIRRATGDNTFIANSPRYIVEALSIVFIAGIAYLLARSTDGIAGGIPVLGALAIGAQRLLPLLQQVYSAWAGIRSNQISVQDAIELLDQPFPEESEQSVGTVSYLQQIHLSDVSFRYGSDTSWVLQNLDLTIAKGSRVGFIGATGSGKSTLLDLVMGLLQPSRGSLAIDGQVISNSNCRAWQAHIAHVPQVIFLTDGTVEENIAFGLPKDQIDHQRVRLAAQQAQISDVIETWSLKYQTLVGERGIRLSGGQRQRIGIARALYKQADVIIFDEATSGLDTQTERDVMEAIGGLSADLTILTIAHRLSTLRNCTEIVELRDGVVARFGTYAEMVEKSASNALDSGAHTEPQSLLVSSEKE